MPLVVENLTKSFGGLRAVADVSFRVNDRAVFGLIGPNGAGKTTVFNLISGIYRPDRGTVRLDEKDLASLAPAQIAAAGVARTFQNVRLFAQLSVIDNLLVACERERKAHLAAAILRSAAHDEDEAAMHDRALEVLRVFELEGVADEPPSALSYGSQRRLEIARALMLRPRVLLLDEPAAGMSTAEADALKTQIRWLRDTFDLAVVLVEHNMQVVMGVCEEILVLDHGETIAEGAPDAIKTHPKVVEAYLGAEAPPAAVEEELPRLTAQSVVDPSEVSQVSPKIRPMQVDPPPPAKLSAEALAVLSKDLMSNLEKGLSQPNLPLAKPATPIDAAPVTPPRLEIILEGTKEVVLEPTRELVAEPTKQYPHKDEDATHVYLAAKPPSGERPSLDMSELEVTKKNPVAEQRHWAHEAARVPLPSSSATDRHLVDRQLVERLTNVDSGWSDNMMAAQAEPSTPDVTTLDTGWSSGRLPAGTPDAPENAKRPPGKKDG